MMNVDRLSFGFHNPNHAAALARALPPLCLGWRRAAWDGRGLADERNLDLRMGTREAAQHARQIRAHEIVGAITQFVASCAKSLRQ